MVIRAMTSGKQGKYEKSQKGSKLKIINKSNRRTENEYYMESEARKAVMGIGKELIKSMSNEEFDNIGSKSDKLHFMHLLGLASKTTNSNISRRKIKTDCGHKFEEETDTFFTPIGVRLKTDDDIERVPFLKNEEDENGRNKVTKNKDTGINPEEDFEYITIKAGDTFDLTLYEFMYLIIRDEYGGYLKVDGEDFYAHLSVKSPAFWRGDAKLPTPTIVFEKGNGSARASIINIDEKTAEGWRIKPEYKRFKPIFDSYNKKGKQKTKDDKNKIQSKVEGILNTDKLNFPVPSLLSLALQEELGMLENVASHWASSEVDLLDRGKEIILSMDESRRELLGSKSVNLHLIHILGFESNNSFGISRPIGVTLVSDEEIKVPVIDIKKDIKTGIIPSTDIHYRTVSAGVSFDVSNYEFMFLILRDEYAGFCELGGNNKGAYLFPNFKLYIEGKNKLPVPKIKYSDDKKPLVVDIHRINENGIKEIKPEYSERFGVLLG